jgi:hypothetical protein
MVRTAFPFHQVIKTDTAHLACLLYAPVTITLSISFIVSPGTTAVSQWKPASAGTCRRSCGAQYIDRRNALQLRYPSPAPLRPLALLLVTCVGLENILYSTSLKITRSKHAEFYKLSKKSWFHFKTLGAKTVKLGKVQTKDPQLLVGTVQNSVAPG